MADDTATTTKPSKREEAPRYRVRLSHPQEQRKQVFSSVSEARARGHVEQHYPRGSEAYIENPDGSFVHYESERSGERGQDAEKWGPFNPEDYRPPAEAIAPGVDEWADQEG